MSDARPILGAIECPQCRSNGTVRVAWPIREVRWSDLSNYDPNLPEPLRFDVEPCPRCHGRRWTFALRAGPRGAGSG